VVDDEPQIRRALRTALVGHGYGYQAEDGASALAMLAAHVPDVRILDLMMPGINGFDVRRQTRTWSPVPIVVLSARGQEYDKVLALDVGADDYPTKPFGIEELLARLRAVLRRTDIPRDPRINIRNITVDLTRHVVLKADAEVHLTPTEFSLLRAFATNIDRVLTHRQLAQRVWGSHASESAQQRRVYLNSLRKKLEDNPSRPRWLVTEPGVRYRLRTGDGQ
jgi:two-component system KDP operon response regulator KdpE